MLINFQVKNFGSFWRPTNFSMIASAVRRHPSHIAEINGRNVLRSAFVFGANAGGKSNFVKAIGFARKVIVDGLDDVSCDRRQFRLAADGQSDDIGVFQFTINADGKFYEYGMAIAYSKAAVVSEWLTLMDVPENPVPIFACDWSGDSPKIEPGIKLEDADRTRFEVYCEDARNKTLRKRTFLSEIADKRSSCDSKSFFSHFASVFNWFRKLKVIFPESTYGGMVRYVLDEEARLSFGSLLHHFDTGIEQLDTQKVDAKKILDDLPAELSAKIISDLTRSRNAVATLKTPDNNSYLARYRDGRLTMEKVVADHGRKDDPFDRRDESDGTQRLYDLLPLQRMFEQGAIVVIDELDRSLHTKATLEFIRTFFERSAGRRSQLIATTHDASILDLALLRQDEIWFVERGDDHASTLFPLTKFKARFDKDIQKDYLLGRYGALPIFRAFRKSAPRGDS